MLHAAMKQLGGRFRTDDGATAVEYALMVMSIALVIITAVALIGTRLSSFFTSVAGHF